MDINTTSFNNSSTASIWSAMELLSYNDFFEQGIAAMTAALQLHLGSLLFFIVSLLWTRIQHKFILILTELRDQITYSWIQRTGGRGTQSKSRDGDMVQDERKTGSDTLSIAVVFIGLVHVAMYHVDPESDQTQSSASRDAGQIQILISSVPLLLPRWFYLEWPTLSKFTIMLWGKLWIPDENMAIALMVVFYSFLLIFVIFTPIWAFLICVIPLHEAEQPLPIAQRERCFGDNLCTHIRSNYLPTLKDVACFLCNWTLRTLQNLLSL
ncbi:hypothetical protein V8C34DRAFT_327837 [Trichoderma compactum]